MTRFILLFILCAIGSLCRAEYLCPDQALDRLGADSSMAPAMRAAARGELTLARTVYGPGQVPAVYEFHRANGNQIYFLSADSRGDALLGYSGDAEGAMPPQLDAWLQGYAAEIAAAEEPSTPTDPRAVTGRADRPAILSFISTRWNQDEPYNNFCPELRGEHCFTGCVATAFAQVMKHYNYPERGTGYLSYQCNSGMSYSPYYYFGRLSLDLDEVTFEWDKMLDQYDNNSLSGESAQAVARLMQAVGYASEMGYSLVGSGALMETAAAAMVQNFGYNEATTVVSRDLYGREAWESMIYDHLKVVGPVPYDGTGLVGGGHAFVCDGYEDGLFHFNWGWGGSYDGFYRLSALAPAGGGAGGSVSNNFSFGQGAVLNMTLPGKPTIEVAPHYLASAGSLFAQASGMDISVTAGDQWAVLYNASTEPLSFMPYLNMTNTVTGEEYSVKWIYTQASLGLGYGYGSMEFTIPATLPAGTYRCTVTCELDNGTEVALAVPSGCTDYFTLVRTSGGIEVKNPAEPSLTVTGLKTLSRIYGDCLFQIEYNVANNSDIELSDGIQAVVARENADGTATIVAKAEATFLDLLPGEKEKVDLVTEMFMLEEPASDATYYLALIGTRTFEILAAKIIDYDEAPDYAEVKGTSFAVVGNSRDVDANDAAFEVGLECIEGYFAAGVLVAVCRTTDFSMLAVLESPAAFLAAGEKGSLVARGPIPGAKKGERLYAYAFDAMNYTEVGDFILFTVGTAYNTTGVENIAADSTIEVNYDRATARLEVNAPEALERVELYDLSGRLQPQPVNITGPQAIATLTDLPAGLYILRLTTTPGRTHTTKLLR